MYKFFKTNNLQILKFIFTGLIASIINYIIYVSLLFVFENILIATAFGYLSGLLCSFVLAKIWVFRNRSTLPVLKSFSLFCFVYFLGGIAMYVVIITSNQVINNYKIAWILGALVASINNFLGSKYFSFRK